MLEIPIIVLKDENVREIIKRAVRKKAKAYRYAVREGLKRESEYAYYQWKALIELADLFNIEYKSVAEQEKGRNNEYHCLEIYAKSGELIAIAVPFNIEFTKKEISYLTKILQGIESKEAWYEVKSISK